MTESLMREAILLGLEDCPEGATREQTADAILLSVKTALRLEARMAKSQERQPEDAPPPPKRMAIPTPGAGSENSMVVLPGQTERPTTDKPLIVMPGDPAAKQPVQPSDTPNRAPMRLSSLKKPARNKANWTIEDLTAHLHEATPETIGVVPHGLKTELTLTRNIITAPPAGAVKVYYTLEGMASDRPGLMGHPEDKSVIATTIGRSVFRNFYVTDPLELDIAGAMKELVAQAKDVFQRRGRLLQSHTPYRPGGHLRIDVDENGRVSDPTIPGTVYEMDLEQPEPPPR